MLQYILNATAIWLLSVIVFDLFLRKESYHGFNRCYLLFTLLMGMVLPLLQWQNNAITEYPTSLQHSMERIVSVKQNIASVASPESSFNWMLWPRVVYISGAFVALCLLVADTVKLAAFFKMNDATKQGKWKVVETGKQHAPFSLLNTLFVCSRAQYSDEEWDMVLVHESRHSDLLHFADLVLLNLVRIMFWFHPLVYVYNKRLLLVHEYQADSVLKASPQHYGRFLAEQTLLAPAPALSHSFNRSPIKNRIIMLTHRSSRSSKWKMVLALPLTLICLACFSGTGYSQNFISKGNRATLRGNNIELSKERLDTVTLMDPINNKESTEVRVIDQRPLKMNGRKIMDMDFTKKEDWPLAIANSSDQYFAYMMKTLKPLLEKLDDGRYYITPKNAIVNEKGQLAYYERTGVYQVLDKYPPPATFKDIDKDMEKAINNKTEDLLQHCPKLKILTINGTAQPYYLGTFSVTVKSHQVNAL